MHKMDAPLNQTRTLKKSHASFDPGNENQEKSTVSCHRKQNECPVIIENVVTARVLEDSLTWMAITLTSRGLLPPTNKQLYWIVGEAFYVREVALYNSEKQDC